MKSRLLPLAALLAAGCGGGPPDWVVAPETEGGFAATECVADSGRPSQDRQVAVGKARAGIATQFGKRVAAMDKAWAPAGATGAARTPFGNVAQQVAEAVLAGLAPTRVEYVDMDDARSLCAMVEA